MTWSSEMIVQPRPGAALTEGQSQRLECLRAVIVMVSGRSVPIQQVERLAMWCFDGKELRP